MICFRQSSHGNAFQFKFTSELRDISPERKLYASYESIHAYDARVPMYFYFTPFFSRRLALALRSDAVAPRPDRDAGRMKP